MPREGPGGLKGGPRAPLRAPAGPIELLGGPPMKEGVSQGSLFCGPGGLWGFKCLFVWTRGGGLVAGIGACLFACCEREWAG